ncbi:MAG: ATP-binding protein [Hyphomicrobiales bacterium]
MDDVLKDFLTESHECLDLIDAGLIDFGQDSANIELLDHVFRLVHTMKGTCGFLNLSRLEALSHASESLIFSFRLGAGVTPDAMDLILEAIQKIKALLVGIETGAGVEPIGDDNQLVEKLEQMSARGLEAANGPGGPISQSAMSQDDLDRMFDHASDAVLPDEPVTPSAQPSSKPAKKPRNASNAVSQLKLDVKVALLEELVSNVTDLIATRAQLLEIARRSDDYELKKTVNHLAAIASRLQKIVVEARVQPIGSAWQQLDLMLRDLAAKLDKDIALVLDGEDIEVDRQIIDLIKAPLAHIVRNCADHGLEAPATRLASGKLALGTVGVTAAREGSDIVIEVLDDGLGLDVQKIKIRALACGLINDDEFGSMSDMQAAQLIFEPGLSTRDTVTRHSGRGYGLDVARTSIEKTGGSIKAYSVRGEGTVIVIRIPVTPAQFSSLILSRAKDYEKIEVHKPPLDVGRLSTTASSSLVLSKLQKQEPVGTSGRDTKILYLEDNSFFRSMLIPIMEAGGYTVTVASCVAEALAQLEEDPLYLAIVCDLDTPDKAGFLFAKMMKDNVNWAKIQLVAVSSLATPLSRHRAREAGFDHCLAKFDRKGLLSCLNKITYEFKVAV